jgi:hypothetical protein
LLEQIHGGADVGLSGDLATGGVILLRVERDLVEVEGPTLRQQYLQLTLIWGVGVFVAGLAVAATNGGCSSVAPVVAPCMAALVFNSAWIAAGIGLGMIFFAYASSMEITYDNIGRFDATSLGPPMRLAFIGVVAIALAILLLSGAITIGFGNFRLNDFQHNSIVAFLLGFFAAYSDVQTARLISSVLDRGGSNARPR